MSMKSFSINRLGDAMLGAIRKHGDLAFAFGVFGILMLLFMRISPGMMDVLLAINLSISLTVLMVSLFIPSASRLPSFPMVLLLCTLFRLALNISSTRLILLEANAGKIIFAFGNFVVGGNYVVGAVVFALLSIIQMIVISKGTERAADVTARFMSDAVPGKQMAIDNDLQRNAIDAVEAQRRRDMVQSESRLYGALTGATYFVKGDAVAGIIISLVNVVGGLVIGVMQQGMSLNDAAHTYSLLTVGDGLVSQIAALMTSIAAGMIITRVSDAPLAAASETQPGSNDVFAQVLAQPRALIFVSGLLLLIGASQPWTGFPFGPFFAMSLLLGFIGFSQRRHLRSTTVETRPIDPQIPALEAGQPESPEGNTPAFPQIAELTLDSPQSIVLEIDSTVQGMLIALESTKPGLISSSLRSLQQYLINRFGVPIPAINIAVTNASWSVPGQYSILINRDPVATDSIPQDCTNLAIGYVHHFAKLDTESIKSISAKVPGTTFEGRWVSEVGVAAAKQMGMLILSIEDAIFRHLRIVISANLAEFLDIQTVSYRLDKLQDASPDLVQCVVKKGPVTLPKLTEILRRLVREQIPIRDLGPILESAERWSPQVSNMHYLVEEIRADLKRVICSAFAMGRGDFACYQLHPDLVEGFFGNREETRDGPVLRLEPSERKALNKAFGRSVDAIQAYLHGAPAVVVVNDPALRPLVRDFAVNQFPHIVVVSGSREVARDVNKLRILATISAEIEPVPASV